MEIMKKTIYIAGVFLLFSAAEGMAQLNESVAVDGKYTPEILKTDRLNTLPRHTDFSLKTTPLTYSEKGVATDFTPFLSPMTVTGWNATRRVNDYKGYIDLSTGSWLNTCLSAGYRFVDNKTNVAGIKLQHNSTSLSKGRIEGETLPFKRYSYDELIGLYGFHNFAGKGNLWGEVDYHLGLFNYYGFKPFDEATDVKAPTQTLNDLAFRGGFTSEPRHDAISWGVDLGVRHFAYRAYHYLEPWRASISDEVYDWRIETGKGHRETHIDLGGNINFPLSSSSAVGGSLRVDLLTYAGKRNVYMDTYPFGEYRGLIAGPTYADINFSPYYRFAKERTNVSIGTDIDIIAGLEGTNAFHIAPAIRIDHNAGGAALWLHLLGGTQINTLAWQYSQYYYSTPRLSDITPVYTPIDATAGVTIHPFTGFSASAGVAYKVTRNYWLGGLYMAALDGVPDRPDMSEAGYPSNIDFRPNGDYHMNIHGLSLGGEISYTLGTLLTIKGNVAYQPQNEKKGYDNGLDRPRWILDLHADLSPIKNLSVNLDYNYRGVRAVYYGYNYYEGGSLQQGYGSWRLPDLTNLSLGAAYQISPSLRVWLQGSNLLNRHDYIMPMLSSRGLTLSIGAGWLF